MRWSLSVSVFVHSALLLSAALALPDPEEFELTGEESVPVDILTIEDFNRLRASTDEVPPEELPEPVEEAEPLPPEPEPSEPEEVAALPEPEAPTPPPEPELVPEAVPEPEPEAPAEEQISYPLPPAKPEPPPRRPDPEPDRFDPDNIAALLDKLPEENEPAPVEQPEETGQPDYSQTPTPVGTDAVVSADERGALIRQIEKCWSPPIGVSGAESLLVRLKIYLHQDGRLDGAPEFLNTSSNAQFRAAAEAARRAVIRCQPYDMPAEKFGAWREIIINFDPSKMFRS